MKKISFNDAIKLAGKELIKEESSEYLSTPNDSAHFSLKFRFKMWFMFKKELFLDYICRYIN